MFGFQKNPSDPWIKVFNKSSLKFEFIDFVAISVISDLCDNYGMIFRSEKLGL